MVDFAEKPELTQEGEKLGPAHYIAPEMLNAAAEADGTKADIYSLGKLMWKLATGQKYPLPGTHFRNVPALTISGNVRASHTCALDALLEAMTLYEPQRRPTSDDVSRELSAWLAPTPVAVRSTDLSPFTKRAQALSEAYVESQRRRAALQAEADEVRSQAFAQFTPVLETIARELRDAGIGRPSTDPPLAGRGAFYHALTGKQDLGRADRISLYEYGVTLRIDDGRTFETLFGGTWRVFPAELVWGADDSFVLGLPRESQAVHRLATGLTNHLANAVERLISGMEKLKQPRETLVLFDVRFGGEVYKLIVSEQQHLDGLSAARALHNADLPGDPIASDAEYVQFILSSWVRGEDSATAVAQHNEACPDDRVSTPQEAFQATLDRAVESYWKQFIASDR